MVTNSQTRDINQSIFSNLPKWNIEAMTGYKPQTTYWQDFSIADYFVLNGTEPGAIEDTHDRSWPHLKDGSIGIKYLTEYIMVLNWKLQDHYSSGHKEIAAIYDKLWRECDQWACENLNGDDADYYYRITD